MKYQICDTHNDFLTELSTDEIPSYIKQCQRENVTTICASYWSTRKDKKEILAQIKKCANLLRESNFLLHIEDLWWVQDENSLDELIKIKPFSYSLTWNNQNLLASGTKARGGLTAWGKECLSRLSTNGIIIDTAHLNRQSFRDVTRLLPHKIYCSHTGFYGVKRHKRNLTDSQISQIVRSDGFIGLFFYDKCVQKTDKTTKKSTCLTVQDCVKENNLFSSQDIVQNLNYFTSRWGFDNIGLGTDFYGIESPPKDLENYADFSNLYDRLLEEGYTKSQIDKIFYQNFEKFRKKNKQY